MKIGNSYLVQNYLKEKAKYVLYVCNKHLLHNEFNKIRHNESYLV